MIDFRPVTIEDKALYEQYHIDGRERGCEYTFANLCIWGQQNIAFLHGHLLIFSNFDKKSVYPFPLGKGDKRAVLDAIISDAKARDIPCLFTGIYKEEKELLEELYPNKFRFVGNDGTYDYVYDINDLADLRGRKYHSKRNHIHRFKDAYPDYYVEPITKDNLPQVKELVDKWYEVRKQDNPDSDYDMEQIALSKALDNYSELDMDGLVLKNGDEILAMTAGSRMLYDTFDVHFEKARLDVDGAYTVINCEFAKYLRNKYPELKFLDREEDMGLEGLRKAKQSYKPHHMIEKYWAQLIDDSIKIDNPDDTQIPELKALWKEAFGDTDKFVQDFFSTGFSTERCRCVTVKDKVAAALYWFECSCEDKRIAYIYAVATAKIFRGMGLCHMLMEDTHRLLKTLGFEGAVLVPGTTELFNLYSGMGYEVCSSVKEFECDASNNKIRITEIDKDNYARLRREFLPERGVIQENENLNFLEKQAKCYTGDGFLLAARIENDTLQGIELLGDIASAPDIVCALGCEHGKLRTVGEDKAFAMFYPLSDNSHLSPAYFGLAFD